ncbi:hypothetical protein PN466_25090 [Roseofilum reptotaenium CS-1145]|uniref:Uncharacterized protein n=1 Tax=Roseofilum reptotaenium AO1-A TaxID=1925591 RepID=A0A1L9QVP0_9CYAN|nr:MULTISPECIES: hypothetical protein [Roseofilum]OJJ26733.1 hypothetical protein BI308_04990 [Roseofilum reptotaenium AO1-A]MBP0015379.1 hypothetical protein [Roseofilum sp. SID3]MBP0025008.1 hypothetical protein [Roseofilum sp. SID2]MBP0027353.1 hypothetical protein [Roseofilum sp. Guam]MBP0038525.1 hypothetical protein [Roseofilum sp. SID1]
MLTSTEGVSDYISDLFGSVGSINAISFEEWFFLQTTFQILSSNCEEHKAVHRILRAVRRGQIKIIRESVAS